MKLNKYFEEASKQGLEQLSLTLNSSKEISIKESNHEIEEYNVSNNTTISAKGLLDGRLGTYSSEDLLSSSIPSFISTVKELAKQGKPYSEKLFYKPEAKYKKVQYFNKQLSEYDIKLKIAMIKDIEDKIFALDKRITDVNVYYSEVENKIEIANTKLLKLSQNTNYFVLTALVYAKNENETVVNYIEKFGNDLSVINNDEVAKEVVKKTIDRFNSSSVKSGKYNAIFVPEVMASLMKFYLGHISLEAVKKNSSLFKDKVNSLVASKKLSIIEEPARKNIFARYFDDEGVATKKKAIIKSGVLMTYINNLELSEEDNIAPTGNGYGKSKVSPATNNVIIKRGSKPLNDMIASLSKGLIITELEGLHAGINPITGDFSLQAKGYMIENGVVAKPVSLITVAGNIVGLLKNITCLSKEGELLLNSIDSPYFMFKKVSISGK